MAVVATAELEGSSNVSGAWSADLEKARTRVDEFGKQANKSLDSAAAGGQSAAKQLNAVYQGAQALAGSAVLVGAARLGSELWEAGGAAQEVRNNLDALTGGQADKYFEAVAEGADGMISKMESARITSEALNYGLSLSADQMGELAEASTVFADILQTDTAQAYDTLTDAIGKGNARMLQQLGIVAKGADMQAEINRALKENAGITYSQATQIAAYNLVLERKNELERAGVGQVSSASDASERINAEIENTKSGIGEWLANGLMPWIEGSRALNKALDEQSERLLLTTSNAYEYNQEIQKLNQMTGRITGTGLLTDEQFVSQQGAARSAAAQRRNDVYEQVAHRDDTAPSMEFAATVDQLDASFSKVVDTLREYAEGVERQAVVEMQSVQAADLLTSGQAKMSDVFSTSMGLLGGYNLTQQQTRDAYEALGLATGELTQKDIEYGQGIQTLTNLAASGNISWTEYGEALMAVQQGADAASIAQQKQLDVLRNMGDAAADFVDRQAAIKEATEAGSGMEVNIEEVQAQLEQYKTLLDQASGEVETQFATNLDAGVMAQVEGYSRVIGSILDNANPVTSFTAITQKAVTDVDYLYDRVARVKDKTITVTANVVVNDPTGFLPPGPQN